MQYASMGRALVAVFLSTSGHAIGVYWPVVLVGGAVFVVAGAFAASRERRLARSGIHDIDRMDGRAFEHRLALLFDRLGYRVEETPYVGDYGADLIVTKAGVRIAVQAKRSQRPVGVKAVQEIVSAKDFYRCAQSMVVTNAAYTAQARKLAAATGTELWGRQRLSATLLATGGSGETVENTAPSVATGQPDLCRTCGKVLSPKVLAFCLDHPERFGGHGYCFEHQRSVRPADVRVT